jgi:hypothetical protein
MHCIGDKVERLAILATATSVIGGLPAIAPAQTLSGFQDQSLSYSSFSNSEQYRRQKMLADIGLAEQPTFFNLLPGKKLEFSFGKQALFSMSENKNSFAFTSKNFNAGYDTLKFKGKSSLNQIALQTQFGFGASKLSFGGFRVGDEKSSIDRQSFALSNGSSFSLKAERTSIDKEFNRIADLPNATPEEKKKFEQERGFERSDISASFNPTKGLSFSTDRYNSDSKDSGLSRTGYRDFGSLSFGGNGAVSFLNEGSESSDNGTSLNKRSRQLFSFGLNSKNLSFSGNHDVQSSSSPGNDSKVTTTGFGLSSQGKLPFKAFVENKSISANSFQENTKLIDFQIQPTKSVALHARLVDTDRNQGESSKLSVIDWSAAVTSKINFSGVVTNFSSDQGNDLSVNHFKLQGEIAKGYQFLAMQESQNGERFGSRQITDLSFSTPNITSVKPFSSLSFSARNYTSELNGAEESHITSFNLSAQTKSLRIQAEHLDLKTPSSYTKREQGITISNIPKPTDKVTASVQYKTREVSQNDSAPRTINSTIEYKASSNSKLGIKYSLHPENEKREPLQRSDFDLTYRQDSKDVSLNASIGQSYDYAQDFRSTRLQVGMSSKFKDGSKLDAMIGGSLENRHTLERFTPLMGVSYERKISADDFINLQTAFNERGWQFKLSASRRF